MSGKKQKSIEEKRAEFIAGLYEEVPPPKSKKLKSVTIERVADLYLAKLAQQEIHSTFLNDFLDNQRIYYTYETITECLELLLNRKFIVVSKLGFSTFKISRAKNIWERRLAEAWEVPACTITDAGLHFVTSGQELDSVKREIRAAEKKAWKDKAIGAVLTIATGLVLMGLKWYFIDRK